MTKFLKRIGTIKNRFEFEVLLHSIEIPKNPLLTGDLKISLKKGNRMVETKGLYKIDSSKSQYILKEPLLFQATLYLNKKSNKYLEKLVNFFLLFMEF